MLRARLGWLRLPLLLAGVLTLAFPCFADDAKDEAIKKDRQQIKGTWQIVGLEINGNPANAEDIQKMVVVNGSDGTWALYSDGEMVAKGTSTFDPTQKPKTLDFEATEGGAQGSRYQGIYELGESKRRMCFSPPDKPRPTEFVSTPGSGIILVKFQRKKEE